MIWLLFIVLPLVEFYLLLYVGALIGFWSTVALVVSTGLVGAALARHEGARVIHQWREALGRGEVPAEGVLGGLLVLIGGVLLVTPGVLTDLTGLLLLLPPTRRRIGSWLRARLERRLERAETPVSPFGVHWGTSAEGFPSWPSSAGGAGRGPSFWRAGPRAAGSRRDGPPPVIDTVGEEVD